MSYSRIGSGADEVLISEGKAREMAESYVRAISRGPGPRLVIPEECVSEIEVGWLFEYTSERYLKTRDPGDALYGPAPFLVDRDDGFVFPLGPVPDIEENLEEYCRVRNRFQEVQSIEELESMLKAEASGAIALIKVQEAQDPPRGYTAWSDGGQVRIIDNVTERPVKLQKRSGMSIKFVWFQPALLRGSRRTSSFSATW